MSYAEYSQTDNTAIDHMTDRARAADFRDEEDHAGRETEGGDARIPVFLQDKFRVSDNGKRLFPLPSYVSRLEEFADAVLRMAERDKPEAQGSDAHNKLTAAHEALEADLGTEAGYGLYRSYCGRLRFGAERLVRALETDEELTNRAAGGDLSESGQGFQATNEARIDHLVVEVPLWYAVCATAATNYAATERVADTARDIAMRAADSEARFQGERYLVAKPTQTAADASETKAFARKAALAKLGQL